MDAGGGPGAGDEIVVCLAGDVMLGRGIDQVLPHPGDPELSEPWVADARTYVELAEAAHGPVPRPAGFAWPWGDLLEVLRATGPDAWVLNLETAVTRAGGFARGKSIHYRMHPANLPCLAAARPDVCALANNHVLDFGRDGLAETLDSLAAAALRTAGAGHDAVGAWRPAAVALVPRSSARGSPRAETPRLLVFSVGMPSSGIPLDWAAAEDRSGIALVPAPSREAAAALVARFEGARRPGDRVAVSVHWGSNWGYRIPTEHVRFAHDLVDGGADLVHGHSSHHPRPLEVYHDRLILYGCGDLVDDYEGITGYEQYRDDLRVLYTVRLDRATGALRGLLLTPFRARRLTLRRASPADARWLHDALTRHGPPSSTPLAVRDDASLALGPG
ncbi:CapA family protein [Streptomyces sp. NRRL S-87]|uniref:CapA family protein n=1 Tax=Streptomyces sp. NRRL S-87 TaxID=1463920 RepID=UPI000B29FBFA|nr:CapA family protein [Streptomyces sp. NRRL S-87]